MITQEQAAKRFEGETLICTPTDKKRLIIPAFGFEGGIQTKRPEYVPPDYHMEMQDVVGLEFFNPKDNATQVLKQADGCIICYDAPGLKEKVDAYIKEHPDTFKTADGVRGLLELLSKNALDPNTGKADVYDTDTAFAAGLIGAPAKDKIVPGMTFVGAKKKETVKAFKVAEGVEFEGGPTKTPPIAEKGGAYIVSDSAGMRMVQADAFQRAYAIVKKPVPTRVPLPNQYT
ncbi:MAG: hypothetical protein IKS41_00165 [Alphaproteobacteria bacterium]|nr:hypothetical protein [Alphaproteobacteria bacterium]